MRLGQVKLMAYGHWNRELQTFIEIDVQWVESSRGLLICQDGTYGRWFEYCDENGQKWLTYDKTKLEQD